LKRPPALQNISLRPLRLGEVLVRMAAAPINPSDLVFLRGRYGVRKALPVVPGFEGSGTVVAGRGRAAQGLVGRRVACRAPEAGNGTWAEYMICPADTCVPLLPFVSDEQGASFYVNPLTAWMLLSIARQEGHRAFVQTAAASALGRMISRLAKRMRLRVISVVRRADQIERLRKEGHAHVLDGTTADFPWVLRALCGKVKARLALDAVGGPLTGILAESLEPGGRVIVYGALSGRPCAVPASAFIFEGKRIEGFWLTETLKHLSAGARARMALQVQRRLSDDLQTNVQARFPLSSFEQAVALYQSHRSQGKVLLIP
jgi:NADPH:quinone reductase-like Zn-dependent oxidoreductase